MTRFSPKKNGLIRLLLLGACLALPLAGCGKKPSFVDPPEGTPKKAYPRTYPDPATDPTPAPDSSK